MRIHAHDVYAPSIMNEFHKTTLFDDAIVDEKKNSIKSLPYMHANGLTEEEEKNMNILLSQLLHLCAQTLHNFHHPMKENENSDEIQRSAAKLCSN